MSTEQRRLALRVTLKLMTLIALITVGAMLLDSITEETTEAGRTLPTLEIEFSTLAPGEFRRIPWAAGNLLLLHRPAETMSALAAMSPAAPTPPYLLLYDRGGNLGCPLQWYPPGSNAPPIQPWMGGLRESCDGVWYDAAGRPYPGQQSERELTAPPYTLKGEGLLSVGASGDNAAPQR